MFLAHRREFRRLQIGHPAEIERRRLERHRANGIVRTVIRAGFVDRQQLHAPVAQSRRPSDELPQRRHIATAKVMFTAQGK
jgi:hypothetical protein